MLVTVRHPNWRILIKSNLKMILELLLKHHLVILLLILVILNHNWGRFLSWWLGFRPFTSLISDTTLKTILSHLSNERSRISSSDGDVDSDLNNSRASISSEDEHKNEKLLKDHLAGNIESKRHSLTTSDTDYSIDIPIKSTPKKNRVVSSLTIFLANPTNTKPNPETKSKVKTYTREELLNRSGLYGFSDGHPSAAFEIIFRLE